MDTKTCYCHSNATCVLGQIEQEQNANAQKAREEEIATANPLLNLAAALGQAPGVNTTVPGTFAVKRRWDDGVSLLCFLWFGTN